MELLVGLVQALVFMLLTAVFTMLICQHEEGHEPRASLRHDFGGLTVFNRGSRRESNERKTYMSLMPMLAELTATFTSVWPRSARPSAWVSSA